MPDRIDSLAAEPTASSAHRLLGQAGRFLLVGVAGFGTDAAVLYLLLWLGLLGPLWARLPSFLVAVTLTYALNRNWTFSSTQVRGGRSYLTYLAVQGLGLLTNFGVYSAFVLLGRGLLSEPLIALAIGAGCSLVVNFLGARWLAFRA
jgi:putative flippase GtrA